MTHTFIPSTQVLPIFTTFLFIPPHFCLSSQALQTIRASFFGEAAGVPSLTDSIPVRISKILIQAGRHVIGFVDWAQAGTLTYTAGSVHAIGHSPLWGRLSICIHFSVLIMCFSFTVGLPSWTIDDTQSDTMALRRPWDCEDAWASHFSKVRITSFSVISLTVYGVAISKHE